MTASPAPPLALSVQEVVQETFWRAQFPQLSIQWQRAAVPARSENSSPAMLALYRERIMREGYFRGQDPVLGRLAPVLVGAIERCVGMGIPPTFIFLFDEAWECFSQLQPIVASLLGEGYRHLPDFWAWHVNPQRDEGGWTPHRDKGRHAPAPDGSPLTLTVWIPLTEATPFNGCIYVVPSNRDGSYNTPDENQLRAALPDIRALPAQPGEFLSWNQAVMHWGSRGSQFATQPRMSMALEFQRGEISPFNQPLLPPLMPLTFQQRLVLIAKQILQYQHMYSLPPDLASLAMQLVQSGRWQSS